MGLAGHLLIPGEPGECKGMAVMAGKGCGVGHAGPCLLGITLQRVQAANMTTAGFATAGSPAWCQSQA